MMDCQKKLHCIATKLPNYCTEKIRTNPDSQSDGLSDPNGQTGPKMDINLPKWIQMDLTGTKSN